MKNKQLIKIINEEISGFDFLGNEEYLKEQEGVDILKNEDFQKQFICDLLLKRKEKVKTIQVVQSEFGSNWERNGYLTIDYIVELAYTYDATKEPAKFGLQLKGDRIQYSEDGRSSPGDRWTAPLDEAWFDQIDWDAIDVNMFMIDERDDDIEFLAFEHAPERIQHLFLRDLLGAFISEWAGRGMGTPADYDNAAKWDIVNNMTTERKELLAKVNELINKRKKQLLDKLPSVHEVDDGIIIRFFAEWDNCDGNTDIKYKRIITESPDEIVLFYYLPKGAYFELKERAYINCVVCLNGCVEIVTKDSIKVISSNSKVCLDSNLFEGRALENTYLITTNNRFNLPLL